MFQSDGVTARMVERGVKQRVARKQAGDSMCLVVVDFVDALVRQLVQRCKVI